MKSSTFHRQRLIPMLAAGLGVLLAVAASAQQESVSGKGIFAHGDAVLVFADVKGCGSEPQLPSAQVFVSTDGGKTWQKHGPALEGSEFEFSLADSSGIWLAGIHTAEGPGIDPFILVPASSGAYEWTQYAIYEGPAALEGIARQKDGTVLAWVRHLDIHRPDWPGGLYLHRSADGGRTWTSAHAPSMSANGTTKFDRIRFDKIGPRNGNWRLSDLGDGGFLVQHRKSDLDPWQEASRFSRHDCGALIR